MKPTAAALLLILPAVAGAQTPVVATQPTHYVTVGGSASSSCTAEAPCTLTRAFALAGTSKIPAGSWIDIAPGIYSQAAITTTGGGVTGFPIRFVGAGTNLATGTRLTGTRTSLPAASWTLCPDQVYTYCTPFDEATSYVVGGVAQRPPVTTWVPIAVDDRQAPAWAPSGRAFDLDEPVKYTERWSASGVELQHCTFFHDLTNNVLRIHPCGETAPADADNFYAGPDNWGSITFTGNGDFLALESMSIEHTTGSGITVASSATGTVLHNLRMLSAQLLARGGWTKGSDILIKQVLTQGAPHAQCYSSQYGGSGLASRSCWNAFGEGYGLILGQERSGYDHHQAFDRVAIERGWNGITMSEGATLEHAVVWGFANHGIIASGMNVTLRHSIVLNSQDAVFESDNSWSNHTYEHNLFVGGTLWYCGRSGAANGSICPTGWTFRHNIVATMVTDWMSEPTAARDCNVWMPRNAAQDLLRVIQVPGTSSRDYRTLDAIIAGTPSDDRSRVYPPTSWTDGSIFATHTSQQTYPVNLTLAAGGAAALTTTCGERAGPDTLATGSTIHLH